MTGPLIRALQDGAPWEPTRADMEAEHDRSRDAYRELIQWQDRFTGTDAADLLAFHAPMPFLLGRSCDALADDPVDEHRRVYRDAMGIDLETLKQWRALMPFEDDVLAQFIIRVPSGRGLMFVCFLIGNEPILQRYGDTGVWPGRGGVQGVRRIVHGDPDDQYLQSIWQSAREWWQRPDNRRGRRVEVTDHELFHTIVTFLDQPGMQASKCTKMVIATRLGISVRTIEQRVSGLGISWDSIVKSAENHRLAHGKSAKQ